jgi:very-short-patch-repair endonuclease
MPLRYKRKLKPLGRRLRSNLTDAEKLLWRKIRRGQINDLIFNRQKPIGNYIVDFYCDKAKLVIEIDGGQHYEKENVLKDKARDRYFYGLGLKVLRFTNLDILKNIDSAVNKIYQEVK